MTSDSKNETDQTLTPEVFGEESWDWEGKPSPEKLLLERTWSPCQFGKSWKKKKKKKKNQSPIDPLLFFQFVGGQYQMARTNKVPKRSFNLPKGFVMNKSLFGPEPSGANTYWLKRRSGEGRWI